jgi:hypothetical protein
MLGEELYVESEYSETVQNHTVKLDSPDAVLILGDFNDKCNK